MSQRDASEEVPVGVTGTNGAQTKNSPPTGTRRKSKPAAEETTGAGAASARQPTASRRSTQGKANDEVAAQLLVKLESVHQELGRERLLREQAEIDARHKLEMAHERIHDLEEKLGEQQELESALLAARQRVADLEVQLALKHEGRRERRHHARRDKRTRRWWAFGR
jgi:hypothetical protein